MWEIDLNGQTQTFIYSLCLGALLCLFYDIIRAIRKVWQKSAAAVFFEDLFFWIISAFATFIFLIARTSGEIRGYVLVCELVGFVLCRLTFSRVFFFLIVHFFAFLGKIIAFVNNGINVFYTKTELGVLIILGKIYVFVKYLLKSVKKLLKKLYGLLYTKKSNINMERSLNETKTET